MLGDNMDVCDDNGDNNFRGLDRKQAMLLETQEKRQCLLTGNVDHHVMYHQDNN
ncbi:unnamed protein product [Prunus armeniaca]|uniref:Uncharacterized protein n=1 Tax=Prunus armeniaca TaxID=36596 RepID=A0A6J5ULB0_PRUAR|nr:unnamed protein product [Prunus armeniaca]